MHVANWLDAIRANDPKKLRADAEQGHQTATVCHLAEISHQVGKTEAPGVIREKLKASAPATEIWGTVEEHMKGYEVDLEKNPFTLGAYLEFDAKSERFTGGVNVDKANALLKDSYRAPFTVPDVVA